MRLLITLFAAAILGAPVVAGQTPQAPPPTFRSSVEVTALDVTVVDADGRPVIDLRPADFTVRIDGKPRQVVRAEWIPLARPTTSPTSPSSPPLPEGYSTNEHTTGGRLIVIAIDQPNIRSDGALGVRATVDAFLDRLDPSDRVAAIALGAGVSTPFTTNRTTVKDAIARMSGDMRLISEIGMYPIAASEALEIVEGNSATLQSVTIRECYRNAARPDPACPGQIASDAESIASSIRQETDRTLGALYGLLDSLKKFDAPKTMVLVSEGFATTTPGGVAALGSIAAASRTSIYALKLDDRIFDAGTKRPPPPALGDRQLRFAGLEALAGSSKGGVFEVIGKGSDAFQRLEREISGYYLLGVESTPADTDGKAHPINVQAVRKGLVVRARRELSNVTLARPVSAANPLEAVSSALSSPLITPGLMLHVATFSLRDQDPSKIQLLIHADIGSDYHAAAAVTLGYVISDSKGNVVVHQVGDGRLAPPGGASGPLPYTVTATLEPGEYTLKLAVSESGRIGSVEHPVHADLIDAGALKLSELMIGGPADARELLRPSISTDVAFGGVQGYMEAYGEAANLLMRYEVAPSADAPAVASAVVPGRPAEDGRTIFSYLVPIRDLPPGQYVLRATLSAGSSTSTPIKKIARAFRVVPLPPGATASRPSAPAAAPGASPSAVTIQVRRFTGDEVVQAETLQQFRAIVAPAARPDFDAGVTALSARDFVTAEQRFKGAQRATALTGNGTAPLTYLAATYAASGHDVEASSVWQTALIDGSDYPQIYEWLADALVRARNFEQARSILQEAAGKWPNDPRFSSRLAAVAAVPGSTGSGR